VHSVIAVELVAELLSELRQKARLDERGGGCVDASFALVEMGVLAGALFQTHPGQRENLPGRRRSRQRRHPGPPGGRGTCS
jgi:transcriptional regulator GlxA family with amidase domain